MYVAELDISAEASQESVYQFATEHGCTALLIMEYGPAGGNPLYQFSSDSQDCLEELVSQVLGDIDYQHILDAIREI
jgi:hypothetical protein